MAQNKPITEAPAGKECDYSFVRGEDVSGVSEKVNLSFSRISLEKCVATDDGELYFPTFFNYGILPDTTWLKGRFSADGTQLTVDNDQPLGIYDGHEFYFNLGDFDAVYDYNLIFNLEDDPILGAENCFYIQEKVDSFYYPLVALSGVVIYNADNEAVFNKPVERRLTAKIRTLDGVEEVESTVIDYESPRLGEHFMKGVMPYYPEMWVCMPYTGDGGIIADCNTVDSSTMVYITDGDAHSSEADLLAEIYNSCIFTRNGDGSYTMDDGWYWSNLYYDKEKEMFMTDVACYDITLSAPVTVGITDHSHVVGPVSTEYYDISGCRVSAATKGVIIRVDKYADGTFRSEKFVR